MNPAATIFTTERRHLLEIIDGMVEGIILLEPDRHIAWANDTALAMHGVTELAGLGGTAAGYRKAFALHYRNKRALQPRQYPLDRALAGEIFKDVVVQVTQRRDGDFCRMHQVRSLLLNDAQGAVEGMVLVILDVTDRYSAEERFEKTFAANPAPALICRMSDLRYIKVNQGFLDMTGYAREDILERTAYEFDVLEGAQRREEAVARLREGRTVPQMEADLRVADGGTKLVVVAGQPIEVAEQDCMLFTFNDLEPRRRAEHALRDSEERFSKAFRLAPVPMMLSTPQGVLLEVNGAFMQATGYDAADITGRQEAMAALCADPQSCASMSASLAGDSGVRSLEIVLRTREGAPLDCLASTEPITIHDQACVLCVIQDITERKRSEVELLAAIEAVMQDTSWFSRTVLDKLAQIRLPHGASQAQGGLDDLTAREREVLGLICQGQADPEIAETLGLSRNTVRNHVASLYGKIGVHRRSGAIVWARQRGIVGREPAPPRRRDER